MARPFKLEGERRTQRLTMYFTPPEEDRLNTLAEALHTDKTKLVLAALEKYVAGLEIPPEPLRKARQEAVMGLKQEHVTGYVCVNGHAFWLEAAWPAPPRRCPACGSTEIKTAWGGMVRRGF